MLVKIILKLFCGPFMASNHIVGFQDDLHGTPQTGQFCLTLSGFTLPMRIETA
jgi:hypothetical protein